MKKLVFGALCFVLVSISFFACEKESLQNTLKDRSEVSDDSVNAKRDGIAILRCKPYRNKFLCQDGWGLCECKWFPDIPRDRTASNDSGKPSKDIFESIQTVINEKNKTMLLKNMNFRDIPSDTLFVDSDILLPENFVRNNGYNHITIKKGAYKRSQNDNSSVEVKIEID